MAIDDNPASPDDDQFKPPPPNLCTHQAKSVRKGVVLSATPGSYRSADPLLT